MENIYIFLVDYIPEFETPHFVCLNVHIAGNNIYDYTNRVSKKKVVNSYNLNQPAITIINNGYVEPDRDFKFQIVLDDLESIHNLLAIFKLSKEIYISTNEGLFTGYFESLREVRNRIASVSILLSEGVKINPFQPPMVVIPQPPPPSEVWESYFDDSKWEQSGTYGGSWDGSKWVRQTTFSSIYDIHLSVKGGTTWAEDFRPTKIRVIYSTQNESGENQSLWLYSNTGEWDGDTYTENMSLVEQEINWDDMNNEDMTDFFLEVDNAPQTDYLHILNIEFQVS